MHTLYYRFLRWLLLCGRKFSARPLWDAGCGRKKFKTLVEYCHAIPRMPDDLPNENPRRMRSCLVLVDYPENEGGPYWVWLTLVYSKLGYGLWYTRTPQHTFRIPHTHEMDCLRLRMPIFG